MQVLSRDIPYTSRTEIFKLKPIFDVHMGSALFDKGAFMKYLEDVDEHTYLLFGGDVMDSIIVTDPRYRKSGDATDTDAVIDDQVEEACKILTPFKDRILFIGDGNHEVEVAKRHGTNPGKRLAKALGVPHLGESWFLKLNFSNNGGAGRSIIIYGHHGYGGGGRTEGGSLTKYSKVIAYNFADIYLFGHDHDKVFKEIPRMYWGKTKIQARNVIVALCGSFKRNMTQDDVTTWEESKGFFPKCIGGFTIGIKPGEPLGFKAWVES